MAAAILLGFSSAAPAHDDQNLAASAHREQDILQPAVEELGHARCAAMERRADQPFVIGTVGSSITFGADVRPNESWPVLLSHTLHSRFGTNSVVVHNGAVRGSSADFAAVCWDEIWHTAEHHHAPHLDLLLVEYTWTSSLAGMGALLSSAHALRIPVVALLYTHAPCHSAFGYHCMTPSGRRRWARLFERFGVPWVSNARVYTNVDAGSRDEESRALANGMHPSPLGHRIIAEEFASWIAARCDVPPEIGLAWSLAEDDNDAAGMYHLPERANSTPASPTTAATHRQVIRTER